MSFSGLVLPHLQHGDTKLVEVVKAAIVETVETAETVVTAIAPQLDVAAVPRHLVVATILRARTTDVIAAIVTGNGNETATEITMIAADLEALQTATETGTET